MNPVSSLLQATKTMMAEAASALLPSKVADEASMPKLRDTLQELKDKAQEYHLEVIRADREVKEKISELRKSGLKIQARADNKLTSPVQYRAARKSEADELQKQQAGILADIEATQADHERQTKQEAAPLARLEQRTGSLTQDAEAQAAELQRCQADKAAAYARSVAEGTDESFNPAPFDAAIARATAAADAARDRLAAVRGEIERIRASAAQREQETATRLDELRQTLRRLDKAAGKLAADTAVGVFILALLDVPAEYLPDFKIRIHDHARVPGATSGWEVHEGHVKELQRQLAAPSAAEWLAEVAASGVLDHQFQQPTLSPYTGIDGGWRRVMGSGTDGDR